MERSSLISRCLPHPLFRGSSGQSLAEILIAVAVGAIMMLGAITIIAPALKENTQAGQAQVAVGIGKELLENARSFAESNWHNIYDLQKTSSTTYFLVPASSSYIAVTGTESYVAFASGTVGLVGHWKFDETAGTSAFDFSGNGNNGTSSGVAAATGTIGQSLYFTGSGSTVSFPNISLANQPYTVTAWIYKNNSNDFNIVGGGAGGGNANAHYIVRSSKFYFGNYGCDLNGSQTVNSGRWYHVAFIMDANQNKSIYVNGSLDSGPANSCGYYLSYVNVIGSSCCGGSGDGKIDDVRIYNRALTAAEVLSLYKAVAYNRYFFVNNVGRSAGGNILASGGTDDPSTQKVAVVTGPANITSQEQVFINYLTRAVSRVLTQADWFGGAGQEGPATSTNSMFATSSNVDYSTSTGSITITNF